MIDQSKERNPFNNPYVTSLIRLQQDGKESISGPWNWRKPPLLEVSTDPDDTTIETLLDAICPSNKGRPRRGRWHWLIGSPGNGKSAKLGLLARHLMQRGHKIVSEHGVPVDEIEADWLPYVLEVREEGKSFRFAYLVQDASVVREPYATECDPADNLKNILSEAAAHGTSLLLCTNWGVLQRLFDSRHKDRQVEKEAWFVAVRKAVKKSGDSVAIRAGGGAYTKKTVFDEIEVTFEYLDSRSLLVNSDIFERLVKKATAAKQWDACRDCPSVSLCPFKSNRDDLVSDTIRRNLLNILRRAEVSDGQVIVFREAVALLSVLLAGCPEDHAGQLPCYWVHDQVSGNRHFNLLARRMPSILFGATRLHGMEGSEPTRPATKADRRDQLAALRKIEGILPTGSPAFYALQAVTRSRGLSADVGVERLLGAEGAIPALDPMLEPRHAVELDEFVANVTSAQTRDAMDGRAGLLGLRDIEEYCLRVWEEIFDAIADTGDPVKGQDLYFWVRRWQTACLGWVAAVGLGLTANQQELSNYLRFLETTGDGPERLLKIQELNGVLEKLLTPSDIEGGGDVHVELATSFFLTGRWAESVLRPRLMTGRANDSNAIHVKMGAKHTFVIKAETYSWLSRRHELNLSDLSFNPDILETLRRTHAQAAAASEYYVQNDDVAVVIVDEQNDQYRADRVQGFLLKVKRV